MTFTYQRIYYNRKKEITILKIIIVMTNKEIIDKLKDELANLRELVESTISILDADFMSQKTIKKYLEERYKNIIQVKH